MKFLNLSSKSSAESEVKNILFITLSNIGDVILTTPTLEAIHHEFSNAKIDIVGDPRSSGIFKNCPYLHNFFSKNKSDGWVGIIKLLLKIRKIKYDLAVDLRSDGLLYLIRAKTKIHKLSNKLSMDMHSAEKHFCAIKEIVSKEIPTTHIWLSKNEIDISSKILNQYKSKRILALGLGSKYIDKNWSVLSFVDMADKLRDYFDLVMLVGDQKDASLSKKFTQKYSGDVVDCAGKYNILETAALLKKSIFFVGNDSGLGHLASAVGINTFTIFELGQPHRYRPWGSRAYWHQDRTFNINNVKSSVIANKIKKILKTQS